MLTHPKAIRIPCLDRLHHYFILRRAVVGVEIHVPQVLHDKRKGRRSQDTSAADQEVSSVASRFSTHAALR